MIASMLIIFVLVVTFGAGYFVGSHNPADKVKAELVDEAHKLALAAHDKIAAIEAAIKKP